MLAQTTTESINTQYFQAVFDSVLSKLYPATCECGGTCERPLPSRPYSLRCPDCLRQKSKLAHTPFRNLRIPQWMAGWVIEESYLRHPKVVTALEISRRLGVTYKTALNLKRRVQVMACQMMPVMNELIRKDIESNVKKNYRLPPEGKDVTKAVNRLGKENIVHADTMVLYSMRERYGRKRHKNRGLTSSIYRSSKFGGEQIGILVHQITNGKWVLLDSIPNLTANTVGPLIKRSLPRHTPLFTDRDYTWLYRIYPNHRMVNHSLKSKDKRYRYSRQRWCQNGVHNQKSEGMNNSIKTAFRSYAYIRPLFSTLYLNEWAFFKNLKVFDIETLAEQMMGSANQGVAEERRRGGGVTPSGLSSHESRRRSCGDKTEGVTPLPLCSIPTNHGKTDRAYPNQVPVCFLRPLQNPSTLSISRPSLTLSFPSYTRLPVSVEEPVNVPCPLVHILSAARIA
jgi:hypothetical protein